VSQLVAEHPVAYYTTSNASHYAGVVALLDSLRLVGEEAPLVVVDCGLTNDQRRRLACQATIVPRDGSAHPGLQKTTGPLAHPAEVMVLVDADVIVNRSLTPLLDEARRGRIVAIEDNNPQRFFAEWELLGLGAPSRRTYVNAGHFVLPIDLARDFLPVFGRLQARLDLDGSAYAPGLLYDAATNPFFHADQDILNAMLCTRYDDVAVRLGAAAWSNPPFGGLERTGRTDALCARADGSAPYFLHHLGRKPWLASLPPSVYSELFASLVTAPEAPVRIPQRELPLRLSGGRLAAIDRRRASLQHWGHQRFRGKLHIRPAIARARLRLARAS
jgi:hypothetical protein